MWYFFYVGGGGGIFGGIWGVGVGCCIWLFGRSNGRWVLAGVFWGGYVGGVVVVLFGIVGFFFYGVKRLLVIDDYLWNDLVVEFGCGVCWLFYFMGVWWVGYEFV